VDIQRIYRDVITLSATSAPLAVGLARLLLRSAWLVGPCNVAQGASADRRLGSRDDIIFFCKVLQRIN